MGYKTHARAGACGRAWSPTTSVVTKAAAATRMRERDPDSGQSRAPGSATLRDEKREFTMPTCRLCSAVALSSASQVRAPAGSVRRFCAATLIALLLGALVAGCGGDEGVVAGPAADVSVSTDGVGSDGGVAGDATTDTVAAADGAPGQDVTELTDGGAAGKAVGAACTTAAACASKLCAWDRNGQVCAAPCVAGKCDAGWICGASDPSDTKSAQACVGKHLNLCRPCETVADCGLGGGACRKSADGAGSFCATACAVAADCPKGFTCADKQCVPTAGECLCSAWAIHVKAATQCLVKNSEGACPGTRACGENGLPACGGAAPTAELCDGKDNNCDGQTDEALTFEACSQKGDAGICYGKEVCTDGKLMCGAAMPAKEICDGKDNDCDDKTDEGFDDLDGDKIADCVDPDDDNDGVLDAADNCTATANPDQLDTDKDGLGDACDPDDDGDGVLDAADSCTLVVNPNQSDNDGDGQGDVCDDDDDNDKVPDGQDNCPLAANADQLDTDKDGKGDACDNDDDADGVADLSDNCTLTANKDQLDTDKDGEGDACDADDDNDKVPDGVDNCPLSVNPNQLDTDKDKLGDACDDDDDADGVLDLTDNCTLTANKNQEDNDKDGEGDACDEDDDNDTVTDGKDNCPMMANPTQADWDKDGKGDVCDPDDDDDGVLDVDDNCPFKAGKDQTDTDKDGIGDLCDPDSDNDEVPDVADNCPKVKNKDQTDTDGDKAGDACDDDDDGDGDPDVTDCAPLDKTIHKGATEICDGKDNDCDKDIDPEDASGCKVYYPDTDKDGYGIKAPSRCLCKPDQVWTVTDISKIDCAPLDKNAHPGAVEICGDKIDNNCADGVDEPNAQGCKKYFVDEDKDGFGVGTALCLCAPVGTRNALKGGDCYDKNKLVYPGQAAWFATHRGDGSFDYNCKSGAEKQWGDSGSCKTACFGTNNGWNGTVPGCGAKGTWLDKCTIGWFKCDHATSGRTQTCH